MPSERAIWLYVLVNQRNFDMVSVLIAYHLAFCSGLLLDLGTGSTPVLDYARKLARLRPLPKSAIIEQMAYAPYVDLFWGRRHGQQFSNS
jgi:hypothetical protein